MPERGGVDITIVNAEGLARLGAHLKAAGRGDLRRKLLAGIRAAAKDITPDIQQSARDTLPRRGGLAERVAGSRFSTRTSLSSRGASVRLTGVNAYQIRGMNAGRLRHPVYGQPSVWVGQSVEPGWFDRPIERAAPDVRRRISQTAADVAADITRGL